jgi:CBS domain-containing protein
MEDGMRKQVAWVGALFDPHTPQGRALERELQALCVGVDAAPDVHALECAAGRVHALFHRLIDVFPAEVLTRVISVMNDALARQVIAVVSAGTPLEKIRWCWMAFGSEGRQEQTLSSDQDNGIVFAADAAADAVRERVLPVARHINEALAACGFALCPGQVMAGNPRCCLSMHEWRSRFADWIAEGDPQALLNASIFFDLRPLYGAFDLADALVEWLAMNALDNPRFLLQMSGNALQRTPPLGLLHDFVIEKSGEFIGTIDLKLNVVTLFVDASRIYGLACGARTSGTDRRLRHAVQARRLDADQVEGWIRAFHAVQKMRLEHQHRCWALGTAMHNHLDPRRLDSSGRRALLDGLRQARSLQRRLAQDYPCNS